MPIAFSTEAFGLAALVFLLGVRHGFDPDHLVAIDGLVRSSIARWARWTGVFFSLGHGVVVTLVGIAVALVASQWQTPLWIEHLGAAISIGVLTVLGVANLVAFARAPAGQAVALIGLRGQWWTRRLARANHPAIIAAIGAAFALSFDTISHAALFSLTGASLAGWTFAALLGGVFTCGMALTDGLNGWWVARLVGRAERTAVASRCMGAAIGVLCLLLAASAAAQAISSLAEEALTALAPILGLATLVVVLAAYALGNRLASHGARAH